MTKAKDKLLVFKESIGLSNGLVPTDMMPVINNEWRQSFTKIEKNKHAISDQGWNPLNRALLLNDELRATMTKKESTPKYSARNHIFPPNVASEDPSSTTDSRTVIDNSSESTTPLNDFPIIADELNTSNGTAGDCMKALFSSKLIQETRGRIKEDTAKGRAIKEELLKATRITASIIIKAGE